MTKDRKPSKVLETIDEKGDDGSPNNSIKTPTSSLFGTLSNKWVTSNEAEENQKETVDTVSLPDINTKKNSI